MLRRYEFVLDFKQISLLSCETRVVCGGVCSYNYVLHEKTHFLFVSFSELCSIFVKPILMLG